MKTEIVFKSKELSAGLEDDVVLTVTQAEVERFLEHAEGIAKTKGCTRVCSHCIIHNILDYNCGCVVSVILGEDVLKLKAESFLRAALIIQKEFMRRQFDVCDLEV